mmetsp:Transcript_18678/g.46906  ORF Transcript_18678/g.46906 Transcript_18678/m.46906 type:complete len:206 (-) Transcript_18678:13-630(-)
MACASAIDHPAVVPSPSESAAPAAATPTHSAHTVASMRTPSYSSSHAKAKTHKLPAAPSLIQPSTPSHTSAPLPSKTPPSPGYTSPAPPPGDQHRIKHPRHRRRPQKPHGHHKPRPRALLSVPRLTLKRHLEDRPARGTLTSLRPGSTRPASPTAQRQLAAGSRQTPPHTTSPPAPPPTSPYTPPASPLPQPNIQAKRPNRREPH